MWISFRTRSIRNLATALLLSDWSEAGLRTAARLATNIVNRRTPAWLKRLRAAFPVAPPIEKLIEFLDAAWKETPPLVQVFVLPERMSPPPAALASIEIPQIPTEAALADWLGIPLGRLRWCADTSGRNRFHPRGPLRTYRHCWIPKPNGRSRLLEAPCTHLKLIQRTILTEILNAVPPHDAVHGFRPGRSVVTNAAPHCGKQIVLRFDLRDFFPSVSAARIVRTFRTIGYPERVAKLLAGLCTTRLPRDVWESRPHPPPDGSDHATWQRLSSRHLPQGAPTSPALANLAAYRMDVRLSKLASAMGADYTRYADDLAFSGGEDLARGSKRFATLVAVIAAEEGFLLNHRKTRDLRRAGRQQIAGVVVNVRPNVPRADFDRLKAILINCVRHGPTGQNRANHPDFPAHLSGRVSQMAAVNPARGRKLWVLFDRIKWSNGDRS